MDSRLLIATIWIIINCVSLLIVPISTAGSGTVEGLVPCVVFLIQDVPDGGQAHTGSGFLVRDGDIPMLVTASHVASALGKYWTMIMTGKDGKAVTAKTSGITWSISPTADVACAVLPIETAADRTTLLSRCLPIEILSARPIPPERDIPLTIMGYPLGLGASGYISPLSLESKAASGLITLPRFDNGKLATFILLQDPSIGGLSGGPVFDTGKSYFAGGRQMTVREGVSVVGLIHGVISDDTGGKFAAVVPSTEIVNLIHPAESEKPQ